jgi:hypothetical protein
MTRKLEDLFDLPPSGTDAAATPAVDIPLTQHEIAKIDDTIDKIDAALPGIRDLDRSDTELDELAELAKQSFNDLSDLGMQVDSRYASELFAVAGTMLGHALTAKTAKLNKKLKMIDLQMKKLKLDQDQAKNSNDNGTDAIETAEGHVLSRNDLLERLIGNRDQKSKD